MNDEPVSVRPASLGRALKKGLRAAYDHLGYTVLVSFISMLGAVGLLSLGRIAAGVWVRGAAGAVFFLPGMLFYWLCAVGVICYADKVIYHEHPALADTWSGVAKLFWPALALFAIDGFVTGILLGDAAFFLSIESKAVGVVVGVLCLYLAAAWLLAAMYHLPLLAAQLKMESGPRPFVVIRKSFLLALGSPGFTVGLAFAIIALAVMCALPAGLGMATLFLGFAAFVLVHGLRELFVRYGVVEEEPEVVEDTGWPDSKETRNKGQGTDNG